ncbi:MAG: C39 family peptidase [Vicinamibacterales bacterium]
MTPSSRFRSLLALGILLLTPAAHAVQVDTNGRPVPPAVSTSPALLQVPYLTQTEQLCGGASLAMVLRYWGARDVFAQDFASLLDADRKGIRASRLTQAALDRGWRAAATAGTQEQLQAHLAAGRPVIAMIEDRPGVYHYVVVVGASGAQLVYHDPARSPLVSMTWQEFDRRWAAADRWMLLVMPPDESAPRTAAAPSAPGGPAPDTTAPEDASPCSSLIQQSVSAAQSGRLDEAERGLVSATTDCSRDASAWRELAGVRLLQRRYDESRQLAERAVRLAPTDRYGWELLATARFVTGNSRAALDAWNAIGLPRVGIVTVGGPLSTRYPIVVDLLGLQPRTLLTSEKFARAERRLAELPVAAVVGVKYEPQSDGEASVTATVAERSALPIGLIGWAGVGLRAAFQKEVHLDISGLAGEGEVFSPAFRFQRNRPRILLGLDVPAPGRLPGILRMEAFWERQTYQFGSLGDAPVREDRRRVSAGLSEWMTSWLLLQGGVSLDHLAASRYVSVDGTANVRLSRDRVAVIASASRWTRTSGAPSFANGGIVITARLGRQGNKPLLSLLVGSAAATHDAPLAAWPGASTGKGRGALLRAHPLLDDGIVVGEAFGRRLSFATAEYEHPVLATPYGGVALVGFVDTARAWKRVLDAPGAARTHVDIGTGVRLRTPGGNGTVRLDVAYGLRDHATALSAGYVLPWGRR